MKLIERKSYLEKLLSVRGTPDIKVITGVRRSGKSKLMEAYRDLVCAADPAVNVIHVNFNLHEFDPLLNSRALYDYVADHYAPHAENILLIDEIQMCRDFEKAVNWLHAEERYDIYITGSNAFLLSSDLATLFTGRTFEIKVFPFSFAEYVQYYELADASAALNGYLMEGGMAGSYLYRDAGAKYDYIQDVFNTLIVRDIRSKYNIRHLRLLDRITDYLMDNVSNLSSARSIAQALALGGETINHKTVGTYTQYLCSAFAFYRVRRYDIKGKKYLASNEKYYLSDHAFRYARLGTKNLDYGRVLENVVAVELLRRGYEVYAGVLYKKEIDFVAIKRGEKLYIQVADSIADPGTFQREAAPLLQIRDAYPRLILSRTGHEEYQYEGIRIIDAADWLLR